MISILMKLLIQQQVDTQPFMVKGAFIFSSSIRSMIKCMAVKGVFTSWIQDSHASFSCSSSIWFSRPFVLVILSDQRFFAQWSFQKGFVG